MSRIAVLDTCILLADPNLNKYKDEKVYIPIATYRELDRQKDSNGFVGMRARSVNRNLRDSIEVDGMLMYRDALVILPNDMLESRIDQSKVEAKADDTFLNMTILESEDYELHTHDFSLHQLMRVHSKNSVWSSQYKTDVLKELYSGYCKLVVPQGIVSEGRENGKVSIAKVMRIMEEADILVQPNMFFELSNPYEEKPFLCRYSEKQGALVKLAYSGKVCEGVKAIDNVQKFAMEALLNPEIKLVTMSAAPGSGKSFLSMAAGLAGQEGGLYDRLLIAKNTTPLDNNSYQGFLPGNITEKLVDQFSNYTTTLEALCKDRDRKLMTGKELLIGMIEHTKQIELLDISSIRGASFQNKFIIVDEAEDFDVSTMRAILTRIGEGCKLVVIGDLNQRTSSKLDIDKSGFFAAIDWLQDDPETAHITLEKCYRSGLVARISEKFDNKIGGI